MPEYVVIKYGGHAMDVPELAISFAADLANLLQQGISCVVVHGGGPQINGLLERLRIESSFCDGLRVTDDQVMEVVEMALCGQVNKLVTRDLLCNGVRAAGISGEDGGTLLATRLDERFGRVGEVSTVNTGLLKVLLEGGYTPVVAPVALDAKGQILNINADTAAGSIAGALQAAHFILISDVPGVLDKDGGLIPRLDPGEVTRLLADGTIHSGMIPKVNACLHALARGCNDAIILDGRQPNALRRYLVQGEALGTKVVSR